MTLADLAAVADRLSSEAIRLALALTLVKVDEDGFVRLEKRERARIAKKLGLSLELFHKCRGELGNVGVISTLGQATFRWSKSDPSGSLARTPGLHDDQVDESVASNTKTGADEDTNAREPGEREQESGNGELRPRSAPVEIPIPQPPTPSPHKTVVEAFHQMFMDANDGATPRWTAREGKVVKDLLASHAPEEIIRRAEIMFTEPRRWPTPPFTIHSLSRFFDQYAIRLKPQNAGVVDRDKTKRGSKYYGKVTDVG